jgi:hypothetical protein
MKRVIALVAAGLTVTVLACGGPQLETQTFALEYLDAQTAASLIEPYVYFDRDGTPGTISTAGPMASHLITVRETRDNLDKIGRVLSEYDKPAPMVQLHFQLIEANGTRSVDPEIEDVESALRKLFKFEGYRLIADAMLGGVEGSEVAQGMGGGERDFQIAAHVWDVRGSDGGGTVRFEVRLFESRIGTIFETTANVRAGQTMVLGSTRPNPEHATLILAVRPEVITP